MFNYVVYHRPQISLASPSREAGQKAGPGKKSGRGKAGVFSPRLMSECGVLVLAVHCYVHRAWGLRSVPRL